MQTQLHITNRTQNAYRCICSQPNVRGDLQRRISGREPEKTSSLYFAKFTFSEIEYLGNSAIPGCSRPGFTDYKDGERTTIRLLQIIMLRARNYPLMFSFWSKDGAMFTGTQILWEVPATPIGPEFWRRFYLKNWKKDPFWNGHTTLLFYFDTKIVHYIQNNKPLFLHIDLFG